MSLINNIHEQFCVNIGGDFIRDTILGVMDFHSDFIHSVELTYSSCLDATFKC